MAFARRRPRRAGFWCNGRRREGETSITIDMPPAMEREAREYTMLEGKTLQQMFLAYLRKELERKRLERSSRFFAKSMKRRELTPDPELHCEIKCDLFADESADWESA